MNDWEHAQQQDEQQLREWWMREWHCCYCGKAVSHSFPQPADWECCGEVGHVERFNEQGQWECP